MLGALGLTPDEESAYRALLSSPGATAVELAEALARPGTDVSAALAKLTERGLVIRAGANGLSAAPPAMALGAMIAERRDALRTAELALVTFAEEHRAAMAGRSISELIEVVTGVDAIRHRFRQVQQAARTEIRTFVTAPFLAVPPGENEGENAAIDRGVSFRVVIERAALAEPGVIEETVESLRNGVQVRVAKALPMKLVLADAELGLVPLAVAPDGEPGAVLLHRNGLLAALEALFESAWQQAYPLDLSIGGGNSEARVVELEPEGPTELDRRILALLISGLTDQAVATQLNLSLRTLQRRLRYLMDLAGVDTRMQLGWRAARQDWA
jgi:sugar-specific transcriptional regulator TrmB/DNA-binding transcriptional ArsR family regulator